MEGPKLQENFCVFLQQDPWKHVFMDKKTQEKWRNRRNYVTTFQTLNLGLIANVKNRFEHWVTKTQFKIEYFCRLLDLKNVLGTIPAMVGKTWWKLKNIKLLNLRNLFRLFLLISSFNFQQRNWQNKLYRNILDRQQQDRF